MRVLVKPVGGGLCPRGDWDWVGRTCASVRRLWLDGPRPWGSRGTLRTWAPRGVHVNWGRSPAGLRLGLTGPRPTQLGQWTVNGTTVMHGARGPRVPTVPSVGQFSGGVVL